ncbi:hypothetical protein M5E88_15180 [Akkermansia muciniphila]|nr:hypothetical protein M5E88_15180 [Akkermansia muciniphila]
MIRTVFPFDFCNNGVRISGDAFAPGVFPFGGGKFVPTPCHAESMGFFRQGGKNGLIVTAFPLFLGLWGSIVENLIYSKKNIRHQLSNHFIFSMVANLESGVKIIFYIQWPTCKKRKEPCSIPIFFLTIIH